MILKAEVQDNSGMFCFLRQNFVESDENIDWYNQKFAKIRADFDNLKTILDEINRTTKRLNLCYKLCSASTSIQKEDELQRLLQLKVIILTNNPILA